MKELTCKVGFHWWRADGMDLVPPGIAYVVMKCSECGKEKWRFPHPMVPDPFLVSGLQAKGRAQGFPDPQPEIDRRMEEAARTVELMFGSEEPVEKEAD